MNHSKREINFYKGLTQLLGRLSFTNIAILAASPQYREIQRKQIANLQIQ